MKRLNKTLPPKARANANSQDAWPVKPKTPLTTEQANKAISAVYSAPPINEKSLLLTSAYKLMPANTQSVITSASRTTKPSPCLAYAAHKVPSSVPSSSVNAKSSSALFGYWTSLTSRAKRVAKAPTVDAMAISAEKRSAVARTKGTNMKKRQMLMVSRSWRERRA